MATWEDLFAAWSRGPDESERMKIQNTEAQIGQAIQQSNSLQSRQVRVFTQGSYRNRVNVRKESDIDIGIVCFHTFFTDYPDPNIKEQVQKSFALTDSEYTYLQFKDEVEGALVDRFGKDAVKRSAKTINVKESRYRVEADVSAFFEHRRFVSAARYLSGVELRPDDNTPPRIINWPEQHYENGNSKHQATNHRFKRIVRAVKKLTFQMANQGYPKAKDTPSFLIECLLWNVPNENYDDSQSYYSNIRNAIVFLYQALKQQKECQEWGEVSELKYLFKSSQPWSIQGVMEYLVEVWNYVEYK